MADKMVDKKKIIKEDIDVSCLLCLENRNRVFDLNNKLADTINDVLFIKLENVIKLPKRICYRCYFIVEYMRDFRNVTVRNVTVAENKLIEDNSSIIYDKPLIFNIITDKVLKEQNIPYNLNVTEYINKQMEEKDNDVLIIPQSYRDASLNEDDILPFKQTIFQCTNCPMTYNKKTSLVHHERKHRRQQRKERIHKVVSSRSKVYSCNVCESETVYSTITELREHKKLHVSSMCCRLGCGTDFNASLEREFHESICNQRFSSNDLEQPGVRTRSRSRLGSVSTSRCPSIDSYRTFHRSGWSSDESGDSNSGRTSVKSQRKRKSSYARSVNSDVSNCSTITTDTSRHKNLKNSSRNESALRNGHQSPDSIRSARPRTRKQSIKETDSVKSYPEFLDRINSASTGFQPKNTVESIYYLKNSKQETKSKEKFHCCKCKFSRYDADEISKHETKKHNIQPWFPCNECRKTYTNRKLLDHHKSVTHNIGPLVCAICSEIFTIQQDLQLHLYNHRNTQNECCIACDKKFLTLAQLKVHIDGETDEKHKLFKIAFQLQTPFNNDTQLEDDTQLDDNFQIVEVVSLQSSRASTPYSSLTNDDVELSELSLDFNDQSSVDFNDQSSLDRNALSSLDRNDQSSLDRNAQSSPDRNGQSSLDRNDQSSLDRNAQSSPDRNGQSSLDRNGQSSLDRNGQSSLDRNDQSSLDRNGQSSLDRNDQSSLDRNDQSSLDRNDQSSLDRNDQSSLDRNGQSSLDRNGQSSLDRNDQSSLDRNGQSSLNRNDKSSLDRNGQSSLDRNSQPSLDRNEQSSVEFNNINTEIVIENTIPDDFIQVHEQIQ